MIPKVIHYCWFGKKPMSKVVLKCIESWKIQLPDFELMLWNEASFQLDHPFVKKAYEDKKWAFVSDYVRLKVLCDYGGVYLDTDMLVLKNFSNLLSNSCFVGLESERLISCGVIGAEKNHPYIMNCLKHYDSIDINNSVNYKAIILPKLFTTVFKTHYDNRLQLRPHKYDDVLVLDVHYFYPFPNPNPNERRRHNDYLKYISEESYAVHLWERSWAGFSEFELIHQKRFLKALLVMITRGNQKKMDRNKYFRRVLSTIKSSIFE